MSHSAMRIAMTSRGTRSRRSSTAPAAARACADASASRSVTESAGAVALTDGPPGLTAPCPSAGPGERAPERARVADELRRVLDGGFPGRREVDPDLLQYAARPMREDEDPAGQVHGFGNAVRHEDDRGARRGPDAQQLLVQMVARDLVERAERLVHEEDRRPGHE